MDSTGTPIVQGGKLRLRKVLSLAFSRTWDNSFPGTALSGHRMLASLGSPVAVSRRSSVELGIYRMSSGM